MSARHCKKKKFVGDSVSITISLLVMRYPILCKFWYESLHAIFAKCSVWRQIVFSISVNWIVAPLFMIFSHARTLVFFYFLKYKD